MSHQSASTGQVTGEVKAEPADPKHPTMHIKVYSPFKVYFDEDGRSISGVNATGPFDILPRHHNFISLLSVCDLVVHRLDNSVQRIRISSGVMHVKADKVTVFLDV